MTLDRRHFLVASTALLASTALPASAGEPQVFQSNGIAINGTDPVAYFTQGKPVAGKQDLGHDYNGAKWLFASAENRAAFAADPAKYAPQYGGYCAYAVSNGYTASTDPKAWSIHEGKLYLNYSRPVRALWAASKSSHIASADQNWPSVLDQ